MGVGERFPRGATAIVLAIAGLAALLVPWAAGLTILARPAPPPAITWSLCPPREPCRPVDVAALPLTRPVTRLRAVVTLPPQDARPPLAVHVTAAASAEILWNGVLIGRNGRVGPDRDSETPGRFSAVIPVPPDRIRPGENLVEVRLSAHHLWAPVAKPIHRLSVGPYEDPLRATLAHYLPTITMIGLLAPAFAGGLALWLARRKSGSAAFVVVSGAVLLQAAVEAGKLVLTYPYPWQLARLAAIAGLAALVALTVGLAALGFVEDRRRRGWLILGLVLALVAALVVPPWWDPKALWAFRAGVAAALVASALGVARGAPGALPVQAACVLALALSWIPGFLDSGYYLVFLTGFAAWGLRALRLEIGRPATAAEDVPARPEDPQLSLPDGGSRHLVRASEILHVRADDDYSLVTLTDGRRLTSTANLAALVRLAAGRLVRIHRSHAVNPARIAVIHRAGRFARTVEMRGGERLAVGRTYWAGLDERLP